MLACYHRFQQIAPKEVGRTKSAKRDKTYQEFTSSPSENSQYLDLIVSFLFNIKNSLIIFFNSNDYI